MKFTLPVFSNNDWATDPETVVCTVPDAFEATLNECADLLKRLDGLSTEFMWQADYELLDEDGNPFEPDYRLEGCHVRVYKDGDIQFFMPFKHAEHGEELWTDPVQWSTGEKE